MRCIAKKTLEVALDSGNDVLVQVKANQPTLLQGLIALTHERCGDVHRHEQLGQRNRIETRCTSVWPVAAGELAAAWWPVRCIVQVRRHTEIFSTRLGAWQPRCETAWYVCTRALSARQAHDAVRAHWAIENCLHYVRDVALGEDASRIRVQPGVFAQLRTLALNLLRHEGHSNIKAARQSLAWSDDALLHLCRRLLQQR